VVVTLNHRQYVERCLTTLCRQTYLPHEVIVVDNGSTDGTADLVEQTFPDLRLVRSDYNLGYAGGNNLGFRLAEGDYLAVLNPDTETHADWLRGLVDAIDSEPGIGLATSRICLYRDRERINACGNDVHVTGLGFCRGLDAPRDAYPHLERVPAISGCAFLTRRELIDRIGGLDEDFFAYVEDTDFSIRARLAGYDIVYAPASIVYHDYRLGMRPEKFYLLERNRQLMLLKNFRWSTLAAMLPVLLLGELMMWTFAVIHGRSTVRQKVQAHRWIARNWPRVMATRRDIQAFRRVGDGELLSVLTPKLAARQVLRQGRQSEWLASIASLLFSAFFACARLFVP
jgi:GT2 family glycosyltransferase